MSGPIVRKYGFPNFDKIFGSSEPKHGSDDKNEVAPPPAKVSETAVRPEAEKEKKS